MKKLFFTLVLLIVLSSCGGTMYDRAYIEKVENSQNSDYLYMVTLSSHENEVTYFTNYKFQVGDSLVSSNEALYKNKNDLSRAYEFNDSLIRENLNLHEKIEELEAYNKILIKITQTQNSIDK